MILLAIDTAGPVCAVAIVRDGVKPALLARREERIGRGHAERLMPMIGEALEYAGSAYADLGRIAVAAGPGSFTGVRIGVAAARGLALALDIPAVGIDVLAALAASARDGIAGEGRPGAIVAALDARRDAVYLRAEDISGAILVPSSVVAGGDIRQTLQPFAGRPLVIAGSGAAIIGEALGDRSPSVAIDGEGDHADIATIAALGLRGAGTTPPSPLYLRAPDAKRQPEPALARV